MLRWVLTALTIIGLFLAAVWASARLLEEVRDPAQACARQLPAFDDVTIVSADRHWPPPLIRCRYAIAAIDLAGTLPRVGAVTTKHLVVVGALDASALAVAGLGRRRWRRRA